MPTQSAPGSSRAGATASRVTSSAMPMMTPTSPSPSGSSRAPSPAHRTSGSASIISTRTRWRSKLSPKSRPSCRPSEAAPARRRLQAARRSRARPRSRRGPPTPANTSARSIRPSATARSLRPNPATSRRCGTGTCTAPQCRPLPAAISLYPKSAGSVRAQAWTSTPASPGISASRPSFRNIWSRASCWCASPNPV